MGSKQYKTTSYTEFYYHFFKWSSVAVVLLLLVSVFVLSLPHSSANSSSDSIRISLPTSCTLSGNVTAEHTASMVSGQELRDIGTTEINTICNDKDGYLVYAKGTTQNSLGEVVLASSLGSNYDIKTGNIPSSNGDSSWAMKLSLGTSTFPPTIVSDYDNKYVPVPNDWTKVAYRSASTATNSTATSIFNTTYAVYTTPGQPAGTYTGQVKYVMLHPSTTTVLPTTTLENAFASAGKSKKTGVVDPVTGQTGDFYRMQDMNSSICDAVTPNDNPGYDEIQLVDDRDNKIYWVAKLKDGHCWMTQNLDLDLGSGITLDSNTTDLNDGSLTGAYNLNYSYDPNTGIISWTPAKTTKVYGQSIGDNWTLNSNTAYSMDVGNWYWDGDDSTPSCNYLNTTCDHFSQTLYNTTGIHGSVGNYYNWSAAIASDDSSSLNTDTYNDIASNPQNSICPKGWRLPTIAGNSDTNGQDNGYDMPGSKSEFGRLNYLYNNNKSSGTNADMDLINNPLWFVRAGILYSSNNSLQNSGSTAYYYSSTVLNGSNTYFMYFKSNEIRVNHDGQYFENWGGRSSGKSIRCIAR